MIEIRNALDKDFEEVFDIENKCFVEPYKRKDLEYEFHGNQLNKILVAISNDKVVGFIDFMITFNSATIVQVAVLDEFRHQGIASRLLKEMENCFPKENIDDVVENITLEVRESNIAAQNLYKKDGYEFIVKKPHYYSNGEDAIYMVKRLLLCQ